MLALILKFAMRKVTDMNLKETFSNAVNLWKSDLYYALYCKVSALINGTKKEKN